ncbi:MAG: porin [Hyphomicrobium sp.]|jgi:predicted porin
MPGYERSRFIIGLTAGLFASAFMAQLPARAGGSGDCCADLDARIDELEATTARKGNRAVSVKVTGWVNEALFAWDDGSTSDIYIGTNTVEQSRFRFTGDAKINKDVSAGFDLELGVVGHPSNQWDQDGPASASSNPANREYVVIVRKSNWYLKSETFGKGAVGLNATATYHLTDDADATLTRYVDDSEGAAVFLSGFRVRINGAYVNGLKWNEMLRGFNNSTPGQSGRRDVVRYDTPTIAGFSIAAAWGEDDIGDVALTYKGDIGDFLVLAKAGYGTSNDPGGFKDSDDASIAAGGTACISGKVSTSLPNFQCNWGGAAATAIHKPTGLFLYGGWGQQTVHTDHVFPAGTVLLPTSSMWFLQPGIEKQWLSLGKTAIFGQYRHDEPGSNPGKTVSADITFWQGGIVQQIDAAEMLLYLVYENASGEVTGNAATVADGAPNGTSKIDPFQEVIMGAKINF